MALMSLPLIQHAACSRGHPRPRDRAMAIAIADGAMMMLALLLSASVTATASDNSTTACAANITSGYHYSKLGFKDIKGASLDACCAACMADKQCGGFVLQANQGESGTCHLKGFEMGSGGPAAGATSGVIPGRGHISPPAPPPTPPPAPYPIKPAPKGAKNVLFIISDDMRPSIGAYGLKEAVTPHLDQVRKTLIAASNPTR